MHQSKKQICTVRKLMRNSVINIRFYTKQEIVQNTKKNPANQFLYGQQRTFLEDFG